MTGLPDPSAGVFDTLLVQAGAPVALDAHVRRLAASVRELYGDADLADPGTSSSAGSPVGGVATSGATGRCSRSGATRPIRRWTPS